MTKTPITIELGETVTYQGRPAEVVGFGSLLAAAGSIDFGECHHPTGFVVRVAMAPFGIERTLRASELGR